jgi:quercetin dioxygenase-like cupin family protein
VKDGHNKMVARPKGKYADFHRRKPRREGNEATNRTICCCFWPSCPSSSTNPAKAAPQAAEMQMKPPVNVEDIKWGPAPPTIPPGAQLAVVAGDPSKEGLFTMRLKMPANYKVPAHHHPTDEFVTVISGDFRVGLGDKLDMDKGQSLKSGAFGEMPAGMNHYAWTTEETVVQIAGPGPFAITYVNPADDPSKQATK